MNKIRFVILIFFFLNINAQKCSDIKQNINAYGNFNFIMTDDNDEYYKKQSIESLELVETNYDDNLRAFQQKFPKIYDGKCLNIKLRNTSEKESYLCDKNYNTIDLQSKTLGQFKLISIIDNLYIFKYSGFEIGGYLIFNSSDNYFYSLSEKPKISHDKKVIYSISNDYNGLIVDFIQLDYYRELSYKLHGNIIVDETSLLKYKNTGNYALLINFKREVKIGDENYDVIKKQVCNTHLIID